MPKLLKIDLLSVILIIFIILSCNDDKEVDVSSNLDLEIGYAREYFNQNREELFGRFSLKSGRSKLMQLHWEGAHFNKMDDAQLIIPFHFNNTLVAKTDGLQMPLADISYIMMKKIGDNYFVRRIISIPILESSTARLDPDCFSGVQFVQKLSGETVDAYTFENGIASRLNVNGGSRDNRMYLDCYTIDYYECQNVFVPDYGIDETSCNYSYSETICMEHGGTEGGSDGSDNTGGGGDNSSYPPGNGAGDSCSGPGVGEPIEDCGEGYIMDENGDCVRQVQDPLQDIMKCEDLDDTQLEKLRNVVKEYLTAEYLASCLNNQIYQYNIDHGKELCFKMGTSTGSPGEYVSSNETIFFRDNQDIDETVFGEEFFHVYQDLFYNGLPSNLGRSNVEFEAKLFHDLSHGGQCCIAFWDPEIQEEYVDWIREITDWYSKMPIWTDMSGKYFQFMEQFIQLKPEYNFPIDYQKKPEAIFNLNDCL
ncbi:hypothetical protein [Fulvivirga ligni]|uniref:hypothetical protein n=1 Tax=Fulvivirga ligni TaxID=2904246 RepID=UPI001F248978|nr:hypothetical protein [Fulvivirga ligni]UII22712.1 hypothetical protein LVD16_05665 [Fulvivirga ligni]